MHVRRTKRLQCIVDGVCDKVRAQLRDTGTRSKDVASTSNGEKTMLRVAEYTNGSRCIHGEPCTLSMTIRQVVCKAAPRLSGIPFEVFHCMNTGQVPPAYADVDTFIEDSGMCYMVGNNNTVGDLFPERGSLLLVRRS